ncbi:MAG TPA: UDP-N-acetylglucosamine--N-acetylmuramyl-(pentapeptide) pyrophosphoryl-undecaprenol N-acetylglucosamine transferase [Chloroflexota bacterium]
MRSLAPLRVLLAGGGSGGSATPVLAVASALRRRGRCVEFLYIGTEHGPERSLAMAHDVPFVAVAAGKLRRYWDWRNLTDPARVVLGVVQSLVHVRRFKPHVAFTAGGFGGLAPLVAARALGVPLVVHQQDVVPGLANRLLAPVARRVTVTFRESLPRFPADRTVVTGNPVRPEVLHGDPSRAFARFGFETDVPLVLVTGGGTGAAALNEVVALAAPRLVRSCSVLHLTGRGKSVTAPSLDRYRQVEFLVEEMPDVLAAAEVVVSRAGLGTLTELAVLGKPMVLVPMPRSHQEANAAAFDRADAAVVLRQDQLTPDRLAETVERLLEDRDRRAALAANARRLMPDNAADLVADAVEEAAMAATFRPEEGRRRAGR